MVAVSVRAELAADVAAAKGGDARAWERLVRGFTPVVRAVARRHRLGTHDQDEVTQRTWLALLRSIERIQEPDALAGWLQTAARRESLRVLRESSRAIPVGDVVTEETVPDEAGELHDAHLRRDSLRGAIRRFPARQRALLEALLAEPALSYEEIGARLDMPVGSIGPTRARCLARLRRDPSVAALGMDFEPPRRATRPHRPDPDVL